MMKFKENQLILVSLITAGIINIILWFLLYIKFGFSREPMPLHFNIIYGIDYVGKGYSIYQIPAAGLVIFLVNFILARIFLKIEKVFGYFLIFGSAGAQLFLLIAVLALVVLNK